MMAAGMAFFTCLALFPAMGAAVSIYGYLSDPAVVLDELSYIDRLLPDEVAGILLSRAEGLVSGERRALGVASLISVVLAVWSGRAGVTAAISALEIICGHGPRRGFFSELLVSSLLTLVLLLGALAALVAVVIVPVVIAYVPFGEFAVFWIEILRWLISILSILLAIGVLYRFGPSRDRGRWALLTIGSGLAVLLWLVGSGLLSFYLSNLSNYDQIYGSLGAVIAMLLWFYVSALALLIGAELNTQIELVRQKQSVKTASGSDRLSQADT